MQAPDRRYLCNIYFETVMLICLLAKLEGELISQKLSSGWVKTTIQRAAWSAPDVLRRQHMGTRILWWPRMHYQSQQSFEVMCYIMLHPEQRLYDTSFGTLMIGA